MQESYPTPTLSLDEALEQHEQQFGEQNLALYARMQDESLTEEERLTVRNQLVLLNSGLVDLCLRHAGIRAKDCEILDEDDLSQLGFMHLIKKISRWKPSEKNLGHFVLANATRLSVHGERIDRLIYLPWPSEKRVRRLRSRRYGFIEYGSEKTTEKIPRIKPGESACLHRVALGDYRRPWPEDVDKLGDDVQQYIDVAAEAPFDRVVARVTAAALMARLRKDNMAAATTVERLYDPSNPYGLEYRSDEQLGVAYSGALETLREYLPQANSAKEPIEPIERLETRQHSRISDLWEISRDSPGGMHILKDRMRYQPWYALSYDHLTRESRGFLPHEMMYVIPAGTEGMAFCGHYMSEMIRNASASPADFAGVDKSTLWDGFEKIGLFEDDGNEFTLIKPHIQVLSDDETIVSFTLVKDTGFTRPELKRISVQSLRYKQKPNWRILYHLSCRAVFSNIHIGNDAIVDGYLKRRRVYEAQVLKRIEQPWYRNVRKKNS